MSTAAAIIEQAQPSTILRDVEESAILAVWEQGKKKPRIKDMTGRTFDRLQVLRFDGIDKNTGQAKWLCQCQCGIQKTTLGSNLRLRLTKSCGCLAKELSRLRIKKAQLANITHAQAHIGHTTPEVIAYWNAKARCTNPNHPSWDNYGGRGIEFLFNSFEEFIDALKTPKNPTGKRPLGHDAKGKALYSLDRLNNDGHYEKGNLRWATKSQQQRNNRGWTANRGIQ